LETEFTATAQGVCGDDLLETGEPGNFSQEDLLQLISTGGSGQGFLDPVFVDHEESQNAADLDQIVFEEGQEVEDEEDFLNDPRLGTICSGSNSIGNSERGERGEGYGGRADDHIHRGGRPGAGTRTRRHHYFSGREVKPWPMMEVRSKWPSRTTSENELFNCAE
jgi:hypothetical protein